LYTSFRTSSTNRNKRLTAVNEQEEELGRLRETLDEQVAAKLKERLGEAEEKAAKKFEGQ